MRVKKLYRRRELEPHVKASDEKLVDIEDKEIARLGRLLGIRPGKSLSSCIQPDESYYIL